MINHWWVTRPKRRLESVPEVLSLFAGAALDMQWSGQRSAHMRVEDMLESAGLKRRGERRDQTGGGGRTYAAWLKSLGLLFTQQSTGETKLTLAGEKLLQGGAPVPILTKQVLQYQFPSPFSLSRGVKVHPRFHIRPFIFLLRLLMDPRIRSLSQDEIAMVVITQAENETDACYERMVEMLLDYRERGMAALPEDFDALYGSGKGQPDPHNRHRHLTDTANTVINWLEYTQLAMRDPADRRLRILPEQMTRVAELLDAPPPFIGRADDEEYFQRRYGLDPEHRKDTRNLTAASNITPRMLAESRVRTAFVSLALAQPIAAITGEVISAVAEKTGIQEKLTAEILLELYPAGAIDAFLAEYFRMAFSGREQAAEFEVATTNIMRDVFGFRAKHVGPVGLTPDVVTADPVLPPAGIIDTKAYAHYSISNDHYNRMVHNYIGGFSSYAGSGLALTFFSYIAGGFQRNIDGQICRITKATGIPGSAVPVSAMITLIERQASSPVDFGEMREFFSSGYPPKLPGFGM